MSLGIAFTLLLTLQSIQLGSSQASNLWNGEITPSPFSGIPDEWKRGNGLNTPEEDFGSFSDSMTFSGDNEYQDGNQTISSNPIKSNATSIQQNSTSNPVTLNPYSGPSTANGDHVNLTETNTTTPSPGNSTNTTTTTFPAGFNSIASETFTTTSPPQLANYTKSPSENSTNMTVVTTTMLNHTTVVLLNESSSVSTTKIDGAGGSVDVRGNMDIDIQQQTKSLAWGVILGTGVGVAIVALVIYIIVKRKNYRDFSHKKLVEDMPPEPVLRLDNSEPLDLKFDGFAYYNPGLEGDNIQMTNFPQGHAK